MNTKDIRRLRRPLRPDKNEIKTVYGRYVNSRKEVIADFQEDFQWLEEGEAQQYLDLFRKSLGGKMSKSMHNIHVDPANEQCSLLLELAKPENTPDFEDKLKTLMDHVMRRINFDGKNFVLLAIKNSYPVFKYTPSGRKCKTILDTLHYFMFLVCPVQEGDEELGFEAHDSRFHGKNLNQVIFSPYIAFTYPCLHDAEVRDDMALTYCHKNGEDCFKSVLNEAFGPRKKSMHTYEEQKHIVNEAITSSVDKSVTVTSFLQLQKNLAAKISEFEEEEKELQQFRLDELTEFMSDAGFSDQSMDLFKEQVEEQFGSSDIELPGSLVCNQEWTKIDTPGIRIACRPSVAERITTEERDGAKYLVIKVEDTVEVNGLTLPV